MKIIPYVAPTKEAPKPQILKMYYDQSSQDIIITAIAILLERTHGKNVKSIKLTYNYENQEKPQSDLISK